MGQTAMRAPQRGMRGATVGGGFRYDINENGVAVVNDVHIDAMRSLGFKRCTEENPDVPEVSSISEEEWAAFKAFQSAKLAKDSATAPSKADTAKLELSKSAAK